MVLKKFLSFALISMIFLGLISAIADDGGFAPPEEPQDTEVEVETTTMLKRGTRADSLNVDLVGRVPFGNVWDVWVEGNYAYVAIENSLMILDISNKANPSLVGTYDTDDQVLAVQIVGQYAYLANMMSGLTIVNVATPSKPMHVASVGGLTMPIGLHVVGNFVYMVNSLNLNIVEVTIPSNPNPRGSYGINGAVGVYAIPPLVYVASGDWNPPMTQPGLYIIDATNPDVLVEIGRNDTVRMASDVVVSGQNAYVTNDTDVRIFDVSDPADPFEISDIAVPSANDAELSGNNLFITQMSSGFTILDISSPAAPSELGTYTESACMYIHAVGDYAYAASYDEGLNLVDISNPSNPQKDGDYISGGIPEDIFVSESKAYMAVRSDFTYESPGLFIVDIVDPASPNRQGNYDSPGNAIVPFVEGNYAYLADGDQGLRVVSIANPNNPTSVGHVATPMAADVFIAESYAYLADFDQGLKIYDISNPSNPQEVGTYGSYGGAAIHVSDSIAYMASGPDGLRIINVTDPTAPDEIGSYNPIEVWDVFVNEDYAYVIADSHGLTILDVSTPESPAFLGDLDTFVDPLGVFASWRYVFVADDDEGLRIIDAGDPANPSEIGYYANSDGAAGVFVDDDLAYVAGDEGMFILDVSGALDRDPPQLTTTFPADAEEGVALASDIQLTFSEAMHTSTTESAFSISPDVDGNLSWTGNRMIFTPGSDLAEAETYTITVTADARDLAGNTLDGNKNGIADGSPTDDYSFSFSTLEVPPYVESVFPQHGSDMIPTSVDVIINFSKSMDITTTRGALSYSDGGTTYTNPTTMGQLVWSNKDRTLTFEPFSDFQNDATFTFTVDHTATDITGAHLDGDGDGTGGEDPEDDFIFWFATMPIPPKVLSVSPVNFAEKVPSDTEVDIRFSKSMDEESVEAAFSYSYEGSNSTMYASSGNVSWSSDSKMMTFRPSSELEHEMRYTFTIIASAMDADGITLDGDKDKQPEGVGIDDYEWSFTVIAEAPKVSSVEPLEGEMDVSAETDIIITFDKEMDKDSVEDAFMYTYPGAPDDFDVTTGSVEWTAGNRIFTFNPDSDLEEGVRYTISIDDTAEDIDGIEFEGYEWEFTIKVNSAPVLNVGGVHPEEGTTETLFKFTVVYTDDDDDEPESIYVVINGLEMRMQESDPKVDTYTEGKAYEYEIELDAGENEYHFEASDEKHEVRFPSGSTERKLTVEAVEEEKLFGMFEEEYAGMSTMICGPLGLVIIIVIILVFVMMRRSSRARQRQAQAAASFQTFEPAGGAPATFETFDAGGADMMSFTPAGEEDFMSFTAFEEEPSFEPGKPVLIECPECSEILKVSADRRPFMFPCKCGAKLVLK